MSHKRTKIIAGLLASVLSLFSAADCASAQSIVADWGKVSPPAAPVLKDVKLDPKTSAFLVLDLIKQTCNQEKRPRCIASLPAVKSFLAQARAHHMPVVYSDTIGATAADVAAQVAPVEGEPIVTAHADKFIGTDLDQILKKIGAKTLVIVGTTAEGAVLYTASHAAFLDYKVIVPVEGSTAADLYAEQATTWILANAPTVGQQTTLTSFDKIGW